MKRIVLLLMLVLFVLMFTACHTDNDPWPVETLPAYATPAPTTTVPPDVQTDLPVTTPTPGLNG